MVRKWGTKTDSQDSSPFIILLKARGYLELMNLPQGSGMASLPPFKIYDKAKWRILYDGISYATQHSPNTSSRVSVEVWLNRGL